MTKKCVYELRSVQVGAIAQGLGHLRDLGAIGSPFTFNINKQTLIDDLHAELSALSSRVERARKGEFKLYTGLSWPVIYGSGANDYNHPAFQLAGEMPAARRTPTEFYLGKMAKVAGFAYQKIEEGQKEEARARADIAARALDAD